MCNLFFRSLKRHILSNKSVSIMLLFGVFVAVLCISIMLGYAMGQYHYTAGDPLYATITLEPDSNLLSDIQSFPTKMETLFGESIANILYLTRETSDSVIIGWQGTEAQRWFPITKGRFFNNQEQQMGAKVAFISYEYLEKNADTSIKLFLDSTYDVVGTGWIAEYNIRSAISEQAVEKLFSAQQNREEETLFTIIPYKEFLSNSSPTLILIHFDFASVSDLQKYSEILYSSYPDASISLPKYDSDNSYISNNINGGVRAVILGIIACITIVQIMEQWMAFYKKEMIVYRICGMQKHICMIFLWGHWAVIFLFGSIIAIFAHIMSFPLLKAIDADYAPAIQPLIIVLLLIYFTTILRTRNKVKDILHIQDKGGFQ